MAFVSFKRCSSEPKSSVGVLGASAAAGFVACTWAGAAGLGWAAPVVAPGVGSRRLEGVPGEALDEALDDELLGGGVAPVAAGATGAGTGAPAGGAEGGGSGAIVAGTCVAGRGSASAAGRGAAQPNSMRDAVTVTAEWANRAMRFTRRDLSSLLHSALPAPTAPTMPHQGAGL
jgi:hypothetical protein